MYVALTERTESERYMRRSKDQLVSIFRRLSTEVGADVKFSELRLRFPNMPTDPAQALRYLYRQKTRKTLAWKRLMMDVNPDWRKDKSLAADAENYYMRIDGRSLADLLDET